MQYAAYKRTQKYLEALPQQVFAPRHLQPLLSLERTRRLLQHVGNPEQKFQYIHVTGTSGKGTVSTMVYEMLRAAKKRVGLFTSPHVTTTLERIALNGKLTSVDDFLWAFNRLKPYVDQCLEQERKYVPSHFEVLLVMALLIFHRRGVAWVVLEVGCGGEFDPTNVIPAPRVAAITNIGLDHQHLLGRTKAKIAWTKAGIFKRGSRGLSTEMNPQIQAILRERARAVRMPLRFVPTVNLTFAERNVALATAIGTTLHLPKSVTAKGITWTRLPARIERIAPNVILDGSHNLDKLRALVTAVRMLNYQRIHVLFGIGKRKAAAQCLRPLLPLADRWTVTQTDVAYPPPMPAKVIARILRALHPRSAVSVQPKAHRALAQALQQRKPNELILATGSFYLAGELRKHWIAERTILKARTSFLHEKN
jgi:dihydrofolate synthase / folylpolyglutamate synthase